MASSGSSTAGDYPLPRAPRRRRTGSSPSIEPVWVNGCSPANEPGAGEPWGEAPSVEALEER
eukprot:9963147-Heterocapsa_arctica.AAC.1